MSMRASIDCSVGSARMDKDAWGQDGRSVRARSVTGDGERGGVG